MALEQGGCLYALLDEGIWHMAPMFCFCTSDAAASHRLLLDCLPEAIDVPGYAILAELADTGSPLSQLLGPDSDSQGDRFLNLQSKLLIDVPPGKQISSSHVPNESVVSYT